MPGVRKFSAFGFRDYRIFWFGQLISLSGTWMQSVAQGWLVYSLTESPFYLGMVAAAGSLPILLFTLIGGITADRFKKRNVLLLTQALSIIPALSLGALTGAGMVEVWHVAVLAAFLGAVNAFDIPARQSFIVDLVGKPNLTNAIALNSAAFHSSRMIGPVIAGILIAHIGLPACFYLNAVSFIAVIFALSKIKTEGRDNGKSNGILPDFIEGIQFIRNKPEIYRLIALIALFSLVGIPFITLLPVFAEKIFDAGAKGFGFLVGATGVGAVAAALSLAIRGDVENKHRFMACSALSFSILLLVFSLSENYPVSIVMLVGIGWSLVSLLATANSYIQHSVPDNLRGRAMSVFTFVFLGTAPIGNAILGVMADAISTPAAISIAAVVCIGASIFLVLPHMRPGAPRPSGNDRTNIF
jgi:MFS family permease